MAKQTKETKSEVVETGLPEGVTFIGNYFWVGNLKFNTVLKAQTYLAVLKAAKDADAKSEEKTE